MSRLNIMGTPLREIDERARGLINSALEAGREAVGHLFITDDTLNLLAMCVCAAVEEQITLGMWAPHAVYAVEDMGEIRAFSHVTHDPETGRIVGIKVDVRLPAFIAPIEGAPVMVSLAPASDDDTN